jgi:hypothetical protein
VRQELGAEYDEELVASFVDNVEATLRRGRRPAGESYPSRSRVNSRRAYLALGLIIVGACVLAIVTIALAAIAVVAMTLASIGAGAILLLRRRRG